MNRKILWKFNIIDLLLMAILAVSLIALVYKLTWGKGDGETLSYTFTYVCTAAPRELVGDLQNGVPCADGESGAELGILTFSEAEEIEAPAPASTAAQRRTERGDADDETPAPTPEPTRAPENVRLTLKSELEGRAAKHGVEIEEILYLKGKTFPLIVDQTIFEVYIADIAENGA